MRKIFHNNKSKARIFGTMLIAILVVATSFTVLFLVPQSPLSMNPASAAVSDFDYNKKITIDHTQVNSTQTNIPVLFNFTDANLASHAQSDGDDICFYDSSNSTQYNHEIESYTSGTGALVAWVNITSLSSSSDTVLYMYYGNSTCSTQEHITDTWDGNYLMVQHLVDATTSTTLDSTSNDNDGTKTAANEPNEVPGIIANAQDFDGTNDNISVDDNAGLSAIGAKTISLWVKSTNSSSKQGYISKDDGGTEREWVLHYNSGTEGISYYEYNPTTPNNNFLLAATSITNVTTGIYHHVVATWDGVNAVGHIHIYIDGVDQNLNVQDLKDGNGASPHDSPSNVNIGRYYSSDVYCFDGIIDDVRISNIVRSSDWINTEYNMINNASTSATDPFITLGSEQGDATSSELKGLTSGRITFSGVAGNDIYCNSSGTANEWPEISMTINASTNYTELRAWIGDFNDTTAYINASNVTMYVSSDNSSYGELGTFPDGGGNCTNVINATNWNAGTMGTDPFAGAGLTNKTASIWIVFKIAVPSNTPTDEFWSGAINSFKLYLGHYS